MKVLLVARSFTRGGAATGAANLGLALEAAGLDVMRVSADGKRPVWRTLERVIERALFDAETHCLSLGPPSIDIVASVGAHRPDIVQFCDISANTVTGRALATLDVPTVHRMSDFWPYHGPRHYGDSAEDATGLAQTMFRAAGYAQIIPTARVAPSHWLAERVSGLNSHVIPNAVVSDPTIRPKTLGDRPIRLGFISGKLNDPRKGLSRLGPAMAMLPEGLATLRTHGAGNPPTFVHDNTGPFEKAAMARVYGDIDVLICPSRQDNSPNTVTEALSHGVPVIGQAGTGMETYIRPEFGALLDFWADQPPDLEKALQHIRETFQAQSEAALDFARTTLDPKTVGEAYAALYASLLTGKPG